ncbi:MAG: hypothetical protein RIR51_2069 [Bacteroidota bacterium]
MKKTNCILGSDIRPEIFELIKKDQSNFDENSYISINELNNYRRQYLSNFIENQRQNLSIQDKEVLDSFKNRELVVADLGDNYFEKLSFGEKLADKIANFGGSWTFILSFFAFIVIWIVINLWILATKPFDPYPFILLNLFLSCLAAIQAPIIMMSQNRQESKDRFRNEQDYKVNLSSKLEIRLINEKIDQILIQHHQKVIDFQESQIEYLEEILKLLKKK